MNQALIPSFSLFLYLILSFCLTSFCYLFVYLLSLFLHFTLSTYPALCLSLSVFLSLSLLFTKSFLSHHFNIPLNTIYFYLKGFKLCISLSLKLSLFEVAVFLFVLSSFYRFTSFSSSVLLSLSLLSLFNLASISLQRLWPSIYERQECKSDPILIKKD